MLTGVRCEDASVSNTDTIDVVVSRGKRRNHPGV